jgi:hypothetical protein
LVFDPLSISLPISLPISLIFDKVIVTANKKEAYSPLPFNHA